MDCVRCRVEKHTKLIMMTVPKHKRLTVLCLRINYEVLMNSDIYFKANLNWMCDAHDSCLWNRSGFDPLWTDVALTLRVFRVCSHYLTLITSLLFENLFKRNSENTRKRCDTHFPSILHIHLPRNVCVCVCFALDGMPAIVWAFACSFSIAWISNLRPFNINECKSNWINKLLTSYAGFGIYN